MKTILITGVSGFIGSHLAEKLVGQKNKIIGIDKKELKIKGLEFKKIDLLEEKKISQIAKKSEIFFHLAALTANQEIVDQPLKTLKINFEGTLNVLKSFAQGKGKIFIFPSTGKVYGKIKYLPIDENHPTEPSTILGVSKKITEELIRLFSLLYPEKTFIILRIFNIYGPDQKKSFLIPTILDQLAEGNTITLGNIKAKRDYLYIDDLIAALEKLIILNLKGWRIFNLGSGKAFSAKEIVEMVNQMKKSKTVIKIDQKRFRQGEYIEERCQSGLRRFGWKPKWTLRRGLKELIKNTL